MSEPKRNDSLFRRVIDALRATNSDATSAESRAIIPLTYPNFPAGQQQMALVRTANPSEYRYDGSTIRMQGFNRHPVVHACIRAVADIIASVPMVVLSERGNYESRVDASHPLQKLLDYPAPRFTARQFRSRFAVDFLGYGNSFFQLDRTSPNRPPIAMRAINPESVQQVWIDPEGDPRRYDYANWAGLIVNLPVEDVLHVRDLEMGRPFEADVFGYPRGATAIGSMLADNEATNYVRQIVTNDGTPTFAVLLSDEATTDDASAMQERYKARVVDRGKRGTPAFFGSVRDIKPLGFTLSDLEFPDLRRVSREDICAAFGVDPRMIGIASASSDAGLSGVQYAEARARLVQHTIEPMMAALEDELNAWLSPEFGDVYVTYDHDRLRDLVENDTETSTRIRLEYIEGLRTWEESRAALKLSPLPEPTDSILKTAGRDLVPAAIAVIDPTALANDTPTSDEPMDTTAVVSESQPFTEDVQGQALNGAQVQSLVQMLTLLMQDQLPPQTVTALIKAAFPAVPDALVREMISGVVGFAPEMPTEDIAAPSAPSAAPTAPAVMPSEEEEAEDEEEEVEESEDEDESEPTRAESVTNFPEQGDDKKVSLRNSKWSLFPVGEAEKLKEEWPEIWRKGGNIKGNAQFAKLAPIAKRGGVPDGEGEENAIRLREAWVARHEGDHQLPGVIAQVKWLAVGNRGLDHMRKIIREAKAKLGDRSEPHMTPAPMDEAMARKRGIWERAMQELDRTEETYKSTATAQFARERRSVTEAIRTAASAADAVTRVRSMYRPDGRFAEDWQTMFEPLIAKTYQSGARQVAGVGASIPAAMANERSRAEDEFDALVDLLSAKELKAAALRAINARAARLGELVGDTTAREVLAAIRAGEKAAMSVDEIARLVGRAIYGDARVDARSTMIARTEAAGAMSQGSWDQAKAEGDLFRSKEWLAFADARDTHSAAMDEGRIPIDQPFNNRLMYPLDPNGDADEVINCRCVLAYYDEPA